MAKKKTAVVDDTPLIFDLSLSDTTLAGMVTRRASEAKSHWEKLYGLGRLREQNYKIYTSEVVQKQVRDERYEEIFSDNQHFVAIRTILPFITSNMTQPEITPANNDSLSTQFASDFEKILVEEANNSYARDRVKLALQDVLSGQRVGVLMWVFNAQKGKLELRHLKPDSVVIGKRSRLHDEPDFVQLTQERTIGALIRQFPDKADAIRKQFEIEKGVPSQLEKEVKITQNWLFVEEDDTVKLGIIWMYESDLLLGKMSDPNWVENGQNAIDEHMMPFVFFNFLNDGSGYIDNTSFIEQAQYNQKNYDKRGATIAENAAYAGIGVPVFGKGAVKEETAAKVRFSPVQRVLLDTEDVTKSFTTWTGGALPAFVTEDKKELQLSVQNIYGTNNIQQGQHPDNPNSTATEVIMLRNQAEGRQQELIDCVDNAMSRFYQIESQMIFRYYDTPRDYNFIGDDGQFEHLVISQSKIAKNTGIKIKIKSGSSLPVDRSQKMAQAIELARMNRIGTKRLYKELGLAEPEEAYKEYLREHLLPFGEMQDQDIAIFSREADEDLQEVIGGKMPKDREDITNDYVQHLNEFLLTQKYEQLSTAEQARVSKFIAGIIAQAQRKQIKLSTQQQIDNPNKLMPPIRPRLSITGRDMQPDVLAQVLQNSGYQPSALTEAEMQAGIMSTPIERINANPLTNPAVGQQTQTNEAQQAAQQQPAAAPAKPVVKKQPSVIIHNHIEK